ncbi:MAG: hypothetical protein HYZ33_01845 [Ignavibacteriales bacterium]|nr:hypothetical protein [Ignavibacteriales bacterium]
MFIHYSLLSPALGGQAAHCQQDTTQIQTDSTSEKMNLSYQPFEQTKSSLLAVGLSMAIPGTGQIYNETYWKVPVIWGLGGYWVYEWVKMNDLYTDYRDKFSASITPTNTLGIETYRSQRDKYRDERDKFAWYLGALYFLNVVDAYVGANLYDFEVTPDLGSVDLSTIHVRATFRARF